MINKHLALDEIKQLKMTTHNQRRNWNIYKENENKYSPFTNSCLFIICVIVYNLYYCCYAKTSSSASADSSPKQGAEKSCVCVCTKRVCVCDKEPVCKAVRLAFS